MAQVFLSYDREDAPKARMIAQALERAGHFVWFDLHIKGGAEYGKVIEEALDAADAVVVLWSTQSVQSAWVRDEAAAGRDKNCLIPILIEPINPPMGFRQYQNLDFSSWKGRGKPSQFAELISSIDALGGLSASESQAERATTGSQTPAPKRMTRKWLIIAGAVVLLFVAIGLFIGLVLTNSRDTQTIAVRAADANSDSLARDLLVKLSILQGSHKGSLRLLGEASGEPDADLIFEVDEATQGQNATANLILLGGKDRALLWSKDFVRPLTRKGDLNQQLAYTAAKVIECAVEALASEGTRMPQQTLKLYLNGCSAYSELAASDPRPLVPVFRAIVEQAPRFEGAWAKLVHAESELASSGDWELDAKRVKPQLLRDMASARKLNPDMAEVLIAEADLLPAGAYAQRMELLERAVVRNPESAEAVAAQSNHLMHVGRAYESVDRAKRAAQLDPLSPFARDNLITALAYAGDIDLALEELRKAEQLWPGASNLLAARYRIHLRYGDPEEAFRIQRLGDYGGPHRDAFLRARINPSPVNIEAAIARPRAWLRHTPRAIGELAQVLGAFGKEEELFALLLNWRHPDIVDSITDVLFRPALRKVRLDPRMIAVAKRIGLLDYWQQSGNWPDFCRDPDLPYDCKAEAAKLTARPGA